MSGIEASRKRPLEGDEEQERKTMNGQNGQEGHSSNEKNEAGGSSSKKARLPDAIAQDNITVASSSAEGSSSGSRAQRQPPPPQPNPQSILPYRSSRLDRAFFGMEVRDDVIQVIGDFLLQHCNRPNVEIEAKLGVIIDNNTRMRIDLPVNNEVVLSQNHGMRYRFSSDMTVDQHAFFNRSLNQRFQDTQRDEVAVMIERRIIYRHTREIDQFHSGPEGKIRVTKDQKTNAVVEHGIIKKDRIANLDIFSPRNAFDFRVSVNIETPMPAPSGSPQFERNKDRVSYSLGNLRIDLTQVKSNNTPNNNNQTHNFSQMRQPTNSQLDLTHELEIEFIRPEELIRERDIRINSGRRQPDRFFEMVGQFVNNVRGLMVQGNSLSMQQQQQHQHQHQQRNPQQRHQ